MSELDKIRDDVINAQNDFIARLLEVHEEDQRKANELIRRLVKTIGIFIVVPICSAFTILTCVFCWGYFWSDYNVTQYNNNNSYNELNIRGGDN